VTGLLELTGEVAGELGGPPARGVRRDPEQMHPPRPDLDDERDIQAPEREHAVGVKEVRSQQRGGVGAQESTPGLVAVHRRRDAMSAQDPADGDTQGIMPTLPVGLRRTFSQRSLDTRFTTSLYDRTRGRPLRVAGMPDFASEVAAVAEHPHPAPGDVELDLACGHVAKPRSTSEIRLQCLTWLVMRRTGTR